VDEFELAKVQWEFTNAVLEARDRLEPLISGEIGRGHCSPGSRECYGGKPGKRKTTLKDARAIARTVTAIINRAVNKFEEDTGPHGPK
jgi:hypothetical protein